MDIIATWVYLDKRGEESNFAQLRGISSSLTFQEVYWKCAVVFFETSLRFNKDKRHILFTNATEIPVINKIDLAAYFRKNQVEVIRIENAYQVPKGYYKSWNNQFFEFSIFDYLTKNISLDYTLLLCDSDCVFTKSVDYLFNGLANSNSSAFTYVIDYDEDTLINGLTRKKMKEIFVELNPEFSIVPFYSGGEIVFVKKDFVDNVSSDFPTLWKDMLCRFGEGRQKFNEEAQILSYYYYKFDSRLAALNNHAKRCWTNSIHHRNVQKSDKNLAILHLPAEKSVGIKSLYNCIAEGQVFADFSKPDFDRLIELLLSSQKHYYNLPRRIVSNITDRTKRIFGKN